MTYWPPLHRSPYIAAPHRERHRPSGPPNAMLLLAIAVTACGFPRPADVGNDIPGDSGGSAVPGTVIHVSPSGDDANDGVMSPVKTLKRAIGLAAADTKVTQIALAIGTYSASSGEIFPYTVPPNVTVVGPAGGGAVLAGGKMSPAITIKDSGLQDLDLQDFTTAITATGPASLKNVRVLTSTTAVQAETAAKLTVDNLSISGTPAACGTGIVLNGAAELAVSKLDTRNLQVSLDARDQSVTDISGATISQDLSCPSAMPIMRVASSGRFHLSDSLLDGGSSGIQINAKSADFDVLIKNTIIRNMKNGTLGGNFGLEAVSFQMIGGELSNTTGTAVQIGTGTWTFTGVTIKQNRDLALYIQGVGGGTQAKLVMRGCTVTNNGVGIDVSDDAIGDFGSVSDPGKNVFRDNNGGGLNLDGGLGATHVDAVGNTWNPNTQGADANGVYPITATITGPVTGSNFNLGNGWSLTR